MLCLVAIATGYIVPPGKAVGPLDTLTSGLASITRLPYGTDVAAPLREGVQSIAEPTLTLYEFEACPFCRRVREMITYLDLSVTVKPCGRQSRHREEVKAIAAAGETIRFPYLVDETAGVSLFESADICMHLLKTYGAPRGVETLPPPPLEQFGEDYFLTSTLTTGWMPSLFRFGRGAAVEESALGQPSPAEPLVLYNYEGNQFCRLAREALAELDLPYVMQGTAKGSPRREALRALSGKTTAPYLVDPNTETQMGESADIVAYLWETYGCYEPPPEPAA